MAATAAAQVQVVYRPASGSLGDAAQGPPSPAGGLASSQTHLHSPSRWSAGRPSQATRTSVQDRSTTSASKVRCCSGLPRHSVTSSPGLQIKARHGREQYRTEQHSMQRSTTECMIHRPTSGFPGLAIQDYDIAFADLIHLPLRRAPGLPPPHPPIRRQRLPTGRRSNGHPHRHCTGAWATRPPIAQTKDSSDVLRTETPGPPTTKKAHPASPLAPPPLPLTRIGGTAGPPGRGS